MLDTHVYVPLCDVRMELNVNTTELFCSYLA